MAPGLDMLPWGNWWKCTKVRSGEGSLALKIHRMRVEPGLPKLSPP